MNSANLNNCIRVAALLLSLILVPASALADRCDKALEESARDVIKLDSKAASGASWYTFFCSNEFETFAKSKSSSATITIPGYGSFGSDQASKSAWERRTAECAQSQGKTSDASAKMLFQSFVSAYAPAQWKAWSDCIVATQLPVSVISRGITSGNLLEVEFQWRPVTGAKAPEIIGVYGLNANCEAAKGLAKRTVLPEKMSAVCTHIDPLKPAVVHVETSSGSIVERFEAKLCGRPAGRLILEAEKREVKQVITPISTQIKTKNAHCSKRCKKWRGYENQIVLKGAPGSILKNCSLKGPRGAWNEVMQDATVSQNQCVANVRVWTHPQTWVLSAELSFHKIIGSERWCNRSTSRAARISH